MDTNSVSITHTFDKYHPAQLLYSKCIIKSVMNSQQWKDPFNFTNTAISTLAGQLNYVATRMDDIQTPIPSSSETYANSVSKPFFKVDGVLRKDQEDFTTAFSNTMLLNQRTQQLKALNLNSASMSCLDKTCAQNINTTSESEESEVEESLNDLEQNFEESSLAINKIFNANTRNYYTNPTPPDLQFEERGTFATNHFDGQSIYTWNIDGKAEHELLRTLQEMTMAITARRTKGLDSKTQDIAIINGFQGQLKYWWDNFLSDEEHNLSLIHI